jgi:hypothetical protein
MVAWARKRVPHVDGRTETEKFTNFFRAKAGRDAVKLDWELTWKNWMLNAAERTGQRAGPSLNQSTTEERMAQAQALKTQPGEQADPLPPNTIPGSVVR